MQNSQLLKELLHYLEAMNYVHLYPSSTLFQRVKDASTDGDKIRIILRDPEVQEYIFPNWRSVKQTIQDPIDYYIELRRLGDIQPR